MLSSALSGRRQQQKQQQHQFVMAPKVLALLFWNGLAEILSMVHHGDQVGVHHALGMIEDKLPPVAWHLLLAHCWSHNVGPRVGATDLFTWVGLMDLFDGRNCQHLIDDLPRVWEDFVPFPLSLEFWFVVPHHAHVQRNKVEIRDARLCGSQVDALLAPPLNDFKTKITLTQVILALRHEAKEHGVDIPGWHPTTSLSES